MAITNREKAIADLTEFLKVSNTGGLAEVINDTFDVNFCCEYCVHGGDNGDCRTTTDSCYNGIKKWLEQE